LAGNASGADVAAPLNCQPHTPAKPHIFPDQRHPSSKRANPIGLRELLEKIVLHSFEAVPGDEGESCASPHGKAALTAIGDLKRVYGLDYETYAARDFPKS
jgi:hypothetical protein